MTNEWSTDPTQPRPIYLSRDCLTIMPLSQGGWYSELLQFPKRTMPTRASELLHGSLPSYLLFLTSTAFLPSPENHP